MTRHTWITEASYRYRHLRQQPDLDGCNRHDQAGYSLAWGSTGEPCAGNVASACPGAGARSASLTRRTRSRLPEVKLARQRRLISRSNSLNCQRSEPRFDQVMACLYPPAQSALRSRERYTRSPRPATWSGRLPERANSSSRWRIRRQRSLPRRLGPTNRPPGCSQIGARAASGVSHARRASGSGAAIALELPWRARQSLGSA